jgi:hypothetical protein
MLERRGSTSSVGKKVRMRILWDFPGREESDLELRSGDFVILVRNHDADWCFGETEDGRQGFFPRLYAEIQPDGGGEDTDADEAEGSDRAESGEADQTSLDVTTATTTTTTPEVQQAVGDNASAEATDKSPPQQGAGGVGSEATSPSSAAQGRCCCGSLPRLEVGRAPEHRVCMHE